jgi:hypothetical protein
MAAVKQTAFRFTPEDLLFLDAIQQHTGIGSRTDALRAAIRYYVRAEGIEVERPKRKPKP